MAKLNIVISSNEVSSQDFEKDGNGGVAATTGTISSNDGRTAVIAKSVASHALVTAGMNAIKSSLSYTAQNYGNFTGDYLGQAKIDRVLSAASSVVGAAGTIGAGFMAGGPVGAGVASGVVAIQTTISSVQNYQNEKLNNAKANQIANFNRARIGNILTDGGR